MTFQPGLSRFHEHMHCWMIGGAVSKPVYHTSHIVGSDWQWTAHHRRMHTHPTKSIHSRPHARKVMIVVGRSHSGDVANGV